MKLYKSILFAALAVVASVFTGCSDEGKWDAYKADSETYSFAQSATTLSVSATEVPTEITIKVYRSTASGSATLPIEVSANSTALNGPASVTFQDGSNVADYVVTVNDPEIGFQHKLTAAVSEESVSASGNAKVTVALTVNYTWTEWATGTFTCYFMGCQTEGVKVMKAEGARAYRIMEPYKEFMLSEDYGYTEKQWAAYSCPYIEFSVVEGTAITFKTFQADTYDGTDMIFGYLPSDLAAKFADLDALSQLLDGQTVCIAPYWYVPGVGGWGTDYPIYFELDGSFEF